MNIQTTNNTDNQLGMAPLLVALIPIATNFVGGIMGGGKKEQPVYTPPPPPEVDNTGIYVVAGVGLIALLGIGIAVARN